MPRKRTATLVPLSPHQRNAIRGEYKSIRKNMGKDRATARTWAGTTARSMRIHNGTFDSGHGAALERKRVKEAAAKSAAAKSARRSQAAKKAATTRKMNRGY